MALKWLFYLYGGRNDQPCHTNQHNPHVQEIHLSSTVPSRSDLVKSQLHEELRSTSGAYPRGISWLKTFASFLRSPSQRFRLRKEDPYLVEWLSRPSPHERIHIPSLHTLCRATPPFWGSRPRVPASMHPIAPLSLALREADVCPVLTILFVYSFPSRTSLSSSSMWLLT